jgi:type II secretory pathway pseudopilin PulG
MALPLIPLLGPLLVKGLAKSLPARLAEKWAPRIGKLIALAIAAGLLWLAINAAIGAIREDARNDLLADQAEQRRLALEAQRKREADAAAARDADLAAGAKTDADQEKEITDATKDLPDSRPTARQRARVCVELQQQDKAAGRAPRPC